MKKPKILLYDLETSHNILAKFSLWPEFTHYSNILKEWFIICGAWKELNTGKVDVVSVADFAKSFKKDPTDDYEVVRRIHSVLSEADAVIAHNGNAFDRKKLNARIIYHGLPPLPPIVHIDTKVMAKTNFGFNSNRLDFLARFFFNDTKIKTDNDLWLACLAGDEDAVKKMARYNKKDVILLEKVYNRMAPYCPTKLNMNLFTQDHVCPHCGSAHIQLRGDRVTLTRVYDRFQCMECGKWTSAPKQSVQVKLR